MSLTHLGHFLVINLFVVKTGTQNVPDRLPPPLNLSYTWIDEFTMHMQWEEPVGLGRCEGAVKYSLYFSHDDSTRMQKDRFIEQPLSTEEMGPSGVTCTLATYPRNSCDGMQPSAPVSLHIPARDQLVTDLRCDLQSRDRMSCFWSQSNQVPDLQVRYRVCSPHLSRGLKECEWEVGRGAVRNGCEVQLDHVGDEVCLLFQTSQGGHTRWNTFRRTPTSRVRPPPPIVRHLLDRKKLNFSWIAPDISQLLETNCWRYTVRYSKCGEPEKESVVLTEEFSLDYNPSCQYSLRVRSVLAKHCGGGGSSYSLPQTVGVNRNPDQSMMVCVIVLPLAISVIVLLVVTILWRYKAIICPEVPDPSVFLKEMLIATTESSGGVRSVYVPAQEEVETCKISLVSNSVSPKADDT